MSKNNFSGFGLLDFNKQNLSSPLYLHDNYLVCNMGYDSQFKTFSGKLDMNPSVLRSMQRSTFDSSESTQMYRPYLPFLNLNRNFGPSVTMHTKQFGMVRTHPNTLLGKNYSPENFGEQIIKDVSIRIDAKTRNGLNLPYSFSHRDLDDNVTVILGDNKKLRTSITKATELEVPPYTMDELKPLGAVLKLVRAPKGEGPVVTSLAVLTATGMLYKIHQNDETNEITKFDLIGYMVA